MTPLERSLVDALQDGIPVCEQPFANIAEQLGIEQQTVVDRLGALLDNQVLSRFGPMFDAERMGGAYHLCAMAVPSNVFDAVARQVNAFPEVAHNYQREHTLSMWFVLASDDEADIGRAIARIETQTGHRVYDMPKLSEYYVGLRLAAAV